MEKGGDLSKNPTLFVHFILDFSDKYDMILKCRKICRKDGGDVQAWEIAAELFENAVPKLLEEEEQTWEDNFSVSDFYDQQILLQWGSNVPGSGALERIMVAAVQAMENRGYRADEETMHLLMEGIAAAKAQDCVSLWQISSQLNHKLLTMEKDSDSDYWTYHCYKDFREYEAHVTFPSPQYINLDSEDFRERVLAGWLSQLIGAAIGTMVEGYTSENLYKAYGRITDYLRRPGTYNDDITYELAFLKAFHEKGYDVTSKDIASWWIGLIPAGWSAEELALRNLRMGILPPESGTFANPFNEWIGAQMRGGICGMVAPGDARTAAQLAWSDGEISHANNGIFGEVFNAVLTSLAFVYSDMHTIIETAISVIPEDCEYYSVIRFAHECCLIYDDWHDALAACRKRFRRYNWIHAYPNACCEIFALWYGNSDYEKTLEIITMCGYDVDCNAGMILPVVAIQRGMSIIPERLIHPDFAELSTYMREARNIKLEELVDDTLLSIKKAYERRNVK